MEKELAQKKLMLAIETNRLVYVYQGKIRHPSNMAILVNDEFFVMVTPYLQFRYREYRYEEVDDIQLDSMVEKFSLTRAIEKYHFRKYEQKNLSQEEVVSLLTRASKDNLKILLRFSKGNTFGLSYKQVIKLEDDQVVVMTEDTKWRHKNTYKLSDIVNVYVSDQKCKEVVVQQTEEERLIELYRIAKKKGIDIIKVIEKSLS